jgi:hypothetical protein
MDVDTAATIAGVVRLLRQTAVLAWAAAGAGSPGQLFALGVEPAADQARDLVPDGTDIDGPIGIDGAAWGRVTSTVNGGR